MPVPPVRTLVVTINNAFSNQADQAVQFREGAYAWQQLLIAAGYTVPISMDGTTYNNAGVNTWASAASLEINTIGSGAYFASRAPVGMSNVGQPEFLSYIDNSGADTTPQGFAVLMTFGTYSGGSTSALPTSSAAATIPTSAAQILGYTTVRPAQFCTWRTSRGDVMFAVKGTGEAFFSSFIAIYGSLDGNGGGKGDRRVWLVQTAANGDCITSTLLSSSSYVRLIDSGGTVVGTSEITSSIWEGGSSWTNGRDLDNETMDVSVEVYSNTAAGGRFLGVWVDVYGAPQGLTFGEVDDTESAQTLRRVVIGDFWAYLPTASLPLT